MRKIEVIDGVSIRFPAREPEFDLGVEIGILATLMAIGQRGIERRVSAACLEQLRLLAERFRYVVTATPTGEDFDVALRPMALRPQLRLVRQG